MRPGGRIQAVIDLLQRIETPGDGKDDTPADVVVSGYVRGRRYIGGGDRRFIGNTVFAILRNRARLDWRAGRALEPREQAVAAARLLLGWDRDALEAAFDGGTYSPAALSPEELALFDRLEPDAVEPEPLAVAGNLPAWLADRLGAVFGDTAEAELTALAGPAPVDLRVNTLKADRETARAALAGEGVDATPTPWSPLGLRLAERTPLANLRVFREGLVEVQDEGSQIAAALVDARPGMAVLDLCAGAGGKTLALAAAM
ncbi:MAG: MFS transporter, partial [Bauldia litoralis]